MALGDHEWSLPEQSREYAVLCPYRGLTLTCDHVVPKRMGFISQPPNPAIPSHNKSTLHGSLTARTNGHGPDRVYPELRATPPNIAYPPRPATGSIADLDIVMNYCDFSQKQVYHELYVINC